MFRNVLAAVDGSPHAERALEEAIDIVRQNEGKLTLATVVPDPAAWTLGSAGFATVDYERLHDQVRAEYKEMLDGELAKVPPEVQSHAVLLEGRPGHALVAQVHAGGHDLLAMGSRGRGELRSMVLGSVSRDAVHNCPVPVLIARAP
jgi:nucleotide-binding universal stress UspA family protein